MCACRARVHTYISLLIHKVVQIWPGLFVYKQVTVCPGHIWTTLYSMKHRPSWEANRFSASQEIPRVLWDPKVHYRIHNSSPSLRVLSKTDSVHASSHFSKIHFNTTLPSKPCHPSGLLPSGPPTKTLYATLLASFVLHALPIAVFLTWSPKWYLAGNTERKAPCYVVFSTPCYLIPLRRKYFPQHPILENPQPTFLPQCQRPSFTPL